MEICRTCCTPIYFGFNYLRNNTYLKIVISLWLTIITQYYVDWKIPPLAIIWQNQQIIYIVFINYNVSKDPRQFYMTFQLFLCKLHSIFVFVKATDEREFVYWFIAFLQKKMHSNLKNGFWSFMAYLLYRK